MKKLIITMAFILISFNLFSQNDTVKNEKYWDYGGITSLLFNQIQFINWAKGGESSYSGAALLNIFANYTKNNLQWDNSFGLGFGMMTTESNTVRKTEDKIDINSKIGMKAVDALFYTGLVSFKTQFAEGFNYPNDSVIVSEFMAPGYLIFSVGMDWKPEEWFSLYLSPLTGRYIFVFDSALSESRAFGVEKGKNIRHEFGAILKANFKKEIMTNITLDSKLSLFNNFTDKITQNRGNIVIDWENQIFMKINELISANILIHFLYDHYMTVPVYDTVNGVKVKTGDAPRLQIKEILGLGISFKLL